MNRTQKGALVNLAGAMMCISVTIFLLIEIAVLKRLPESFFEKFWVFIAACVLSPILIIFYRKKQSPTEVDSDERDDLIKKRAVLVSFVSVWILLYVSITGCEACVDAPWSMYTSFLVPFFVLSSTLVIGNSSLMLSIFTIEKIFHQIKNILPYHY